MSGEKRIKVGEVTQSSAKGKNLKTFTSLDSSLDGLATGMLNINYAHRNLPRI